MATPTPSETLWSVAPTHCLPSESILTRFATASTADWQAPDSGTSTDSSRCPLGSKTEVESPNSKFRFSPNSRHCPNGLGPHFRCEQGPRTPQRIGTNEQQSCSQLTSFGA